MQSETIVLILGAFCLALLTTWFQYFYKDRSRSDKKWVLAGLRFLSLFLLALLLINPSVNKRFFESVKPVLAVAVDNSTSIQYLKKDQEVKALIASLKNNTELTEKFDLKVFGFSNGLQDSLDLSFTKKTTNIERSLSELDQVYTGATAPIILVSDGNQTVGKDYTYKGLFYKQSVYPVVVGDSVGTGDSKIEQLNLNKYAFLKNNFPVEVVLTNTHTGAYTSDFKVFNNNKLVYKKTIQFDSQNSSQIINFSLPATRPGVQKYRAVLNAKTGEMNTINNQKNFAVEVIDQKTQVLLVSSIVHPDIGAFKKSIEKQENRSVTIKQPLQVKNLDDYQLVILYQPDTAFYSLFSILEKDKKNYFVVTGEATSWKFLNQVQSVISHEITGQYEYYQPRFNPLYKTFLLEDAFDDQYPPLTGAFGSVTLKGPYDILLYRQIDGIATEDPLLVTCENEGQRAGFLLGEGFWKWRSFSYTQNKTFENIDQLIAKIVQYLASAKKRNRLTATAESFYYGNMGIVIGAEYFTKNYEFDRRGKLNISISNTDKSVRRTIPMLLKGSKYEVELNDLPAGDYDYTVSVEGEKLRASGILSVLEFDIEKQTMSANVTSLRQLATDTKGNLYTLDNTDELVQDLITDDRYPIIQKSREEQTSLIDWKILLGVLIVLLAIEWLIRKYYGFI